MVFLFFAFLATVFGLFPGTWFDEQADSDFQVLVTTYAAVAVILTVAVTLTAFRRGERWAWMVLWVWPAFFVVHGALVFPVDFVFAALGAAALMVTASERSPALAR